MLPSDNNLETEFTFETGGQPIPEDPPFKILLLGDWSGRESRSKTDDFPESRPFVVDRDNFDDVFRKLNVRLNLDPQRDDRNFLQLEFDRLDDFHPDEIFRQVPLFSELRNLRGRLLNSDTFESAAGEVRSWFGWTEERESPGDEVPSREPVADVPVGSDLLDQILSGPAGEGTSAKAAQVTQYTELNRFLGKIVEPYVVRTDENEQAKLLAAVDESTSKLMRSILHHPRFQALESAWRGVYLMVRQIETDVDLKLFLFDISKSELGDNLKSVNSLADSLLYRWLIRDTIETPGGEPFGVVCGNYTFGINLEDIATLIRLAKLSDTAKAPFLSYVLPQFLGISSLASSPDQAIWRSAEDSDEQRLWSTLRALPEAKFLGLAMPRFLARLPYGHATEPAEAFSFEELSEEREHEEYLWANPSFVCGLLLANSFRASGWEMGSRLLNSLSGLPTHFYEEAGETITKPCAEILLTELGCEKLLEEGIMPLISFRNGDRVQIARFQSIALPLSALSGRWN